MAGIIFATVLMRIIRAISDASTSTDGPPADESVRAQPPPQAAYKSKRASCNESHPLRQLPEQVKRHESRPLRQLPEQVKRHGRP